MLYVFTCKKSGCKIFFRYNISYHIIKCKIIRDARDKTADVKSMYCTFLMLINKIIPFVE